MVWLDRETVEAFHEDAIKRYGGSQGIRDAHLLESALASPKQLAHYGSPSLFELAAAYTFSIVRNDPFQDGNKRTAYLAADAFLWLNGCDFAPPEEEIESTIKEAAAGKIGRSSLTEWYKHHAEC